MSQNIPPTIKKKKLSWEDVDVTESQRPAVETGMVPVEAMNSSA